MVDCSGRCETPAGNAGQVRPHRRNVEEAHRPPRGKRASWNEKQPTYLKACILSFCQFPQ
ncbi:hypothetical protein CP883_09750 [Cutibacterium acnes]|nr:hypothetical protein CP883_09750 [Cutibacterium acnes]